MTTASLCPQPNYRSLTLAGAPNAGGKLYTYISGTTTPQVTYTSSTAAVQNANPVIFDANGFANVWLDSSLTYTLLETDSANVTIRTQDVISNAAGATGAAGTFACAAAGGTVNAITASYSPVLTLADKTMCAFVSSGANTVTNPTFAPDGLTAHTITKYGGTALVSGDIGPALSVHILEYNLANTRWELLNPTASAGGFPNIGGYVTNRFYGGLDRTLDGNEEAVSANTLYLFPFVVTTATTFTRIGIHVTTLASTSNARLGIYTAAAGLPATLVLDAGTVSTATTGDKEITISQLLSPGTYFLVAVFSSTPTVYTAATEVMRMWNSILYGQLTGGPDPKGATVSFTYGALPSPYSLGALSFGGSICNPTIWLRVV